MLDGRFARPHHGGMTFQEIIKLWPKRKDLAQDIGQPAQNVRKWYERNSIPPMLFKAMLSAASERGYDLTMEMLFTALVNRGRTK